MRTEDSPPALLPPLDEDTVVRVLDALVFVASEPPTVLQLARTLQVAPDAVERGLEMLARRLSDRGLRLQRHRDAIDLVTAPEVAPWVERLLSSGRPARLSGAALETLAVIAYRQPITRAGIEGIRGVNSDRALAALLARDLAEEVGRGDGIGRPAIFGTTEEFLSVFGLSSLADLPPPEEPDEESARIEVI